MTDQVADGPSLELGRYGRVLRRRWLVVAVLGLLGLALAAAYLVLKPSTYTSSALVAVNVISSDPFNNTKNASSLIDQQTEVQTARSSAVVAATAAGLGDVTRKQVRANLKVELLADATVLRITYTGDSVSEAINGADEAARQFLDYRGSLAAGRITAITDQLTKRRDLLRDDLLQVNRELSRAQNGTPAAVQADSDRQLLNLELNSLVSQINSVSAIDTTGGTVLTSARDAGAFVAPRRKLVLGAGLMAGLLVGLVGAFVRNSMDRRLFDADDVSDGGGGPLLARMRAREETVPASGDDLDAVRSVWERLLASIPGSDPVVTVADISAPAVPSEVALNMALVMGESGRPTEVVLLEYPPEVVNQVVALLHLRPTESLGLVRRYVSPAHEGLLVSLIGEQGTESDTVDLLKMVLREEDRTAEITVMALPPTVSRSARLAAGRLADASIIIVAHKTSRGDVLRELSAELHAVRAGIAGTVMVPRGRRLSDREPEGGGATRYEEPPADEAYEAYDDETPGDEPGGDDWIPGDWDGTDSDDSQGVRESDETGSEVRYVDDEDTEQQQSDPDQRHRRLRLRGR